MILLAASSNSEYSFASPRRQLFSFPPDVIRSMLNNPASHKGLLKLYQTCKYFWSKRPILIADDVTFFVAYNESSDPATIPSTYIKLQHGYQIIPHLKIPLWITKDVVFEYIYYQQRLPNIFRSSAKKVYLESSDLKFEDFAIFNEEKNVITFDIDEGFYIWHSDGSKVYIEELLQHLPNIQHFKYFIDEKCSAEILTKLIDMKFNHKFKYLSLEIEDVHPTFDLDLFYQFIVKNCDANTEMNFSLFFQVKEKLSEALAKAESKWRVEDDDWGCPCMFLKNEEEKMEE